MNKNRTVANHTLPLTNCETRGKTPIQIHDSNKSLNALHKHTIHFTNELSSLKRIHLKFTYIFFCTLTRSLRIQFDPINYIVVYSTLYIFLLVIWFQQKTNKNKRRKKELTRTLFLPSRSRSGFGRNIYLFINNRWVRDIRAQLATSIMFQIGAR